MKRHFVNKLRALASNKKGSEVVEKIFMVVVSVALAAAATFFIYNLVQKKMDEAGADAGMTDDEIGTVGGEDADAGNGEGA